MRVFLDANVVFSAANTGSGIHRLLLRLKADHEILTSDYALEEARRNIGAKRPQWTRCFEAVMDGVRMRESVDAAIEVALPQKDRPILATALKAECDFLLTGDRKHFGHLLGKSVRGLVVASPLLLAEQLYGSGR